MRQTVSVTARNAAPAPAAAASARTLTGWAGPLLLFAGAALLYGANLGRPPHPDELYQLLAAEGLVETGEPRLADGLYTRAYAQTWLIAGCLRLLGSSLEAARLSSLVAIAATAALLLAWLGRAAGPRAAWLAAVGFAVSPFAVGTAQFARIYGVQTLAFVATCVLVYAALVPGTRSVAQPLSRSRLWRRLALLAAAVPPFLLAAHLQPTTLLGAAGLGLWGVVALALPRLADQAAPVRGKLLTVAAALAALAAAWASGLLGELWQDLRAAPLFAEGKRDEVWFYHAWLNLLYPSLWPATALLALAALAARPGPASLALVVFGAGFVLNSLAGPKSLRYLAYAWPFLFVLWGIGLAAAWRALAGPLARAPGALAAGLAPLLPPRLTGPAARALIALALLWLALANPAPLWSAARLAGVQVPGEEADPDWAAARPALEPWLASTPAVVATEELGALYFLGRFDVALSPSKLGETEDMLDRRGDFLPDPRTGRPVVGSAEALMLLMDCVPAGLVVAPARQWGRERVVPSAIRELVEARARPVPLPPGTGVTAFAWEQSPVGLPPARDGCASLPALAGPGQRQPPHP